ncbi:hypothetical protein [Thalassotalea insulae]|nr:hypothetical protein [Thalassotalea insulae]
MSADKIGYENFLDFLKLLEDSPVGSKRTLNLVDPDVWSASSTLKKTPEKKVLVSLSNEDDCWHLKSEQSKLHFYIGIQKIPVLKAGIIDALNGKYDFSVGATGGQNLWFW